MAENIDEIADTLEKLPSFQSQVVWMMTMMTLRHNQQSKRQLSRQTALHHQGLPQVDAPLGSLQNIKILLVTELHAHTTLIVFFVRGSCNRFRSLELECARMRS